MGVSPVFEYQCVWSRVRPRSWWFGSFSVCAVADNSFYNSSHCLLTWRAWMCTWLFCCPFLHREIKWPYFIIFFFFLSWYKMALFYSFWFFSLFGPDASLFCQLWKPCELTVQSNLDCMNTWRKAKITRKPWNACTLEECQLRKCIFKSPRYISSCETLAEHLARLCAISGLCGTSQDLNCLVWFVQLVRA